MNAAIPDEELVGVVELLSFVAEFCRAEAGPVSAALARFMGIRIYRADELAIEAISCADTLARAMGFPDSYMDPGYSRLMGR